jgi:hypothetical protein
VVGGGTSEREDESAKDVLSLDTEAGQAIIVAAIGFGLLWIAVGPGGGPLGHGMKVLHSVALVAASMAVVNFTARAYSLGHPDGPLAKGIMVDL